METESNSVIVATNNTKCRIILEKPLSDSNYKAVFVDNYNDLNTKLNKITDTVLIEASFCNSTWHEISCKIKQKYRNITLIIFSHEKSFRNIKSYNPADCFLEFPFTAVSLKNELFKIKKKREDQLKKILLVDDSSFIHKMVETTLSAEKIKMLHAYNGKEGLKTAETHFPDLIITDIEMPEMNGYELCRQLKNKEQTQDIPIIIQSSLSSGYNFDKGFEAGADDYITKPLVSEELISRIKDFIKTTEDKRETIVVFDSSRMIRKMVVKGLSKQGFHPIEADSPDMLSEICSTEKIDMFIISQIFRNLTGRDIVRNLRKNPEFKKTPVIMLSSREGSLDHRKNRSAGVNDFISKPFSMDRLIVSVEKNLAEYRVQKEKDALGLYISDAARMNAEKIAHSDSKNTMTAGREFKTIIFTDIAGFTPVCEKLPPENVISVLNEYFDNVVQIINRNCGTIDKFIGDAVMAYYGGKENGALMAVNSAIEMLEYLKTADNPIMQKIKIRIGIHSGEVIAGDIGSRYSRRDYTLIGDNVNTAQRLESAAPGNRILISDATYSLIRDNISVEKIPPIKLKGKNREVQAYLVESIINLSR